MEMRVLVIIIPIALCWLVLADMLRLITWTLAAVIVRLSIRVSGMSGTGHGLKGSAGADAFSKLNISL
jgi:hypothetical protein